MAKNSRRRYRLKRKKPGSLKWLMKILAVLVTSVSVYFFIQSSFFAVSSIKVSGTKTVQPAEIIELSGLSPGENIFKIDFTGSKEKVLTHAMIEQVEMEKHLPRTLLITVKERVPLVLVPAAGGFFQIDRQGYLLRKQQGLGNSRLPIITGLDLPANVTLGEKLKSSKLDMGLKMVAQMDEKAKQLLAEIDVSDPQKLKVYTVQGAEVRFGDAADFQKKFKRFLQVLEEEEKMARLDDIQYIDVSFYNKPVVYYQN